MAVNSRQSPKSDEEKTSGNRNVVLKKKAENSMDEACK